MAQGLCQFSRCLSCLTACGHTSSLFPCTSRIKTGCGSRQLGPRKHSTRAKLAEGPDFKHFIANVSQRRVEKVFPPKCASDSYLNQEDYAGNGRKVHFITYGCQMNVSDVEVVRAILLTSGYTETNTAQEADVVLIMTCSVREGAETKVWDLLKRLKRITRGRSTVGVLGCMAERLRHQLLSEDRLVSVVAGPDSYRDLPRLLAVTGHGSQAMNVQLSLEETYADVAPVRASAESKTAFVSIMRGCDNMCTYCIVPFTRGRERSRPISSILEEIRRLSTEGIKQIILLGQNVNSYRDLSEVSSPSVSLSEPQMPAGFTTVYRPRKGGKNFVMLLDEVSKIDPEMRIRFTSPHPKDFPFQLIELIRDRPNLCKQLHLPAQSGSNAVLERMGRGYTTEAYVELVKNIRKIIPNVSLTSDFIAGFCGESEEDHAETLNLIREIKYSFCYVFPYSMREKTRANYKLKDDVPAEAKHRRHLELASVFRDEAAKLNQALIGTTQLALIEGKSRRSPDALTGRLDGGVKAIVENWDSLDGAKPESGAYVSVKIVDATSQTVRGQATEVTSLEKFHRKVAAGPC